MEFLEPPNGQIRQVEKRIQARSIAVSEILSDGNGPREED